MKQYIVRESSTGRVFFLTLPTKAGPDEVYHLFARTVYGKALADTGDVYHLFARTVYGKALADTGDVYHLFARTVYGKALADTGDVDIDVYELPAKPPRGGTVREAFTN